MKSVISKIPYYFTQDFRHWKKIEYFRTVLYIFLLVNTLSLLPAAHEIWAYEGIVGPRTWNTDSWTYRLINILSHPVAMQYKWLYIAFIVGQIGFLITGLFRVLPKLSSVMIWFFTVNLFLKGYLVFTGGEVLVNFLLFYLIFIQRSDKASAKLRSKILVRDHEPPRFSPFQNILNNTFHIVLLIQVCVLYFFSAFYKLLDEYWVSGEAVMYISKVPAFSGDIMKSVFSDNYTLSLIATYATLLYQGLFPLLVWFKKIKKPLLLFGVFFHLSIGFGMGIFTFSLIMIIVYLLFLDEGEIGKLFGFFGRKKGKMVNQTS